MQLDRLAMRIALAALLVAAIVLAIVAIGVMRVGSDAFASLMTAAGDSAEHARQMFDESVTTVITAAAVIGALVGLVVAVVLARRIARPIELLARTAGRTAGGDLEARVGEDGPREIRDLAVAYNTLVDRLSEQEEIRREFIANASHELRTPLTNLQGYLEALRDGVIPPDPATFDSLREEVDRLTRLAASLDLLAGSSGERAGPAALDLAAAVRTSVELARPGFARRSVDVVVDADGQAMVVSRGDELAQVLFNLLQNAQRYTPEGGTVRVEVDRLTDGEARVRVSNRGGPDIPATDLPRVWERFYRVEKSRTRAAGGAGIGLAIVKRIVEDAGGRVGATSGDGETTFWFSLPAA